jgi:hypothetical protein
VDFFRSPLLAVVKTVIGNTNKAKLEVQLVLSTASATLKVVGELGLFIKTGS